MKEPKKFPGRLLAKEAARKAHLFYAECPNAPKDHYGPTAHYVGTPDELYAIGCVHLAVTL